jgi:hypothetical protein
MSWPRRAEAAEPAEDDYHAPRRWAETPDGRGLWVYSCRLRGRLWPLGYCSARCRHHDPADAAAHYREYLLDTARYDGHWRGVAYRCELCDEWTDRFAQLESFTVHRLCPAHLNRPSLTRLLSDLQREERFEVSSPDIRLSPHTQGGVGVSPTSYPPLPAAGERGQGVRGPENEHA